MDISIRLLLLLAFCCILLCTNADGAKQQQLRSAMVVGTVYCDTCFPNQFSKAGHFISDASVSVQCGDGMAKTTFRKEVKTNRHGVFRIRLPPKVSSRNINNIKSCSVKLIKSNEPFCAVTSSATSTGLRLKSKRNGLYLFSAGFFTFKPLKQPDLCYQEPKPDSFAEQKPAQPAFFFFFPPPIPFLPSPPNIGGIPLPPNPLVPPPSLLPPIIPSPPPSLLPPIFPSPPPSFLPPIPQLPLPLLTPPPPPPASLFPPFPFPFPFPPNPLFPGNPPAAPSPAETSP